MKKYFSAILLLTAGMIIGACSSPDENDENLVPTQIAQTIEAKLAATAAIERALAEVLTGTASVPTVTPTITLTPTPTETVTPTPPPMVTVIQENAPVFAGPAVFYALLDKLSFGDQIEILGISENEAWLWVKLTDNTLGWIAIELVDFQGIVGNLTEVESPPSPTAPPSYFITINNNFPWSYGKLTVHILDIGITKQVGVGRSITFKIPGGWHNFIWSLSPWKCDKTILIQNDLLWVIENDNDVCATFP